MPRSHVQNHNALKTLNEETAWVVGWISADGCVDSRNAVTISLAEQDEDVVVKIQRFFQHRGRLYLRASNGFANGQNNVILQFQSQTVVDDLKRFQVFPRKSGKQYFPQIIPTGSESLNRGFIRGYCEGNGSVGMSKTGQPKFSICGSKRILDVIVERLSKLCGVKRAKVRRHSQCEKVFEVGWKCYPALRIMAWIYSGDGPFCDRKLNRYRAIRDATRGCFVVPMWRGESIDGPKPVLQLSADGQTRIRLWASTKTAAKAIGTSCGTIRRAALGLRKTALGFKWQYVEDK